MNFFSKFTYPHFRFFTLLQHWTKELETFLSSCKTSCKRGDVLQNRYYWSFCKSLRKNLRWRVFWRNFQAFSLQLYLKRDYSTVDFLYPLRRFYTSDATSSEIAKPWQLQKLVFTLKRLFIYSSLKSLKGIVTLSCSYKYVNSISFLQTRAMKMLF